MTSELERRDERLYSLETTRQQPKSTIARRGAPTLRGLFVAGQ
jgi:hypothetical protein